jgi:NRPS condensation-like uncharacterized protein
MGTTSITVVKEKVVRKLGVLEKSHLMLEDFLHTNIVAYTKVTGDIPENALRRSLDVLQKRHPLMAVRIERRRLGARFVTGSIPEIPLRVITTPEAEWGTVTEEELNTPLPITQGPLIRCTLVQHEKSMATIILTYSHTIGDGVSGAIMMRELFRFAHDSDNGDSSPTKLKDAMEVYFPKKARGIRGFLAYIKINKRYMKLIKESGGSRTPEYDGQAPMQERWVQIIPRQLDSTTVKTLSEKSKREGTTVGSALAAAHLIAFAHDMRCDTPVPIAVMTNVNIRNRLADPAGEEITNFAGSCGTLHRVSMTSSFWDLAREHRRDMLNGIKADEPIYNIMALNIYDSIIRWIGHDNWAARALDNFYSRFKHKLTIVSSMGSTDLKSYREDLRIDSTGGAASNRASGLILSIGITGGDCMSWNFIATSPLYSRKHIESIADRAVAVIIENIGENLR